MCVSLYVFALVPVREFPFVSSIFVLNIGCKWFVAADNIDETYGVNVQFEESDDDVSIWCRF